MELIGIGIVLVPLFAVILGVWWGGENGYKRAKADLLTDHAKKVRDDYAKQAKRMAKGSKENKFIPLDTALHVKRVNRKFK